jgi:alpha-N-arabinofuranosidase
VVNDGKPISLVMDCPTLPLQQLPARQAIDNFDTEQLDSCWFFLRNPIPDNWSLRSRQGFLRLNGSEVTLDGTGSPAFVGRRQEHIDFTARALLEFNPQVDNEEAGLCLRIADCYHYEIAITYVKDKRSLIVRRRVDDLCAVVYEQEIETGPVVLSITGDKNKYHLGYSNSDTPVTNIASGCTHLLSNEVASIFTGVVIGMYATGNGKRSTAPADFFLFD